jgi:hydroxyacylglutathione hydrolase
VRFRNGTGAEIWHADKQLDYNYGLAVEDKQLWQIGRLKIQALHTPGHTPGSMSYLLHDPDGNPWIVFTGDALFAGDVGRVDLLGEDRMPEMAAMLYETLFNKLLHLDDGVIVCPAHGTGSVCGSSIAERLWTTIGLERKHNPNLQYNDKEDFVADIGAMLERPPYFRKIEVHNIEGAPILETLPVPTPLNPNAFDALRQDGIVLDTRMELGFGGGHIPGALSIWQGGLASFAGWFLPYDRPIFIVSDTDDVTPIVRTLVRLGYDNLGGYLAGGMLAWHMAGYESASIATVIAGTLCERLDAGGDFWVLDVRSEEELVHDGRITGARHIHLTQLPERMDAEVPKDRPVTIFCGSGLRSMIAASVLRHAGWKFLTVVLGGLKGWHSTTCPIQKL